MVFVHSNSNIWSASVLVVLHTVSCNTWLHYDTECITLVCSYKMAYHIDKLFVNSSISPSSTSGIYQSLLFSWQIRKTYEDFGIRSRYLRQGLLITSHSKLWDVITYTCLRYLLLTPKSTYVDICIHWLQSPDVVLRCCMTYGLVQWGSLNSQYNKGTKRFLVFCNSEKMDVL